jgi:hypothetical protein
LPTGRIRAGSQKGIVPAAIRLFRRYPLHLRQKRDFLQLFWPGPGYDAAGERIKQR